ncbi:MATE family efflux transporter [Sphingomonas sp.]|uniref:MATE family efflux transporter n=1 Tax=Sphingomonas sp. TaxID=28214 RepID=UPI0035B2BA95
MSARKRDFLTGSLIRQVVTMVATNSLSMLSFYLVDALAALYLARTVDATSLAALGVAAAAQFLLISVSMGIHIGTSALVSRHIGAGHPEAARDVAAAGLLLVAGSSVVCVVALLTSLARLLHGMGLHPDVADQASSYLWYIAPAHVLGSLGLLFSSLLRANAQPVLAMTAQLSGVVVAALLDPVLIYWLGLGLPGAAVTFVLARLVTAIVAGTFLFSGDLLTPRSLWTARPMEQIRPVLRMVIPLIVANLSTPFAMLFASAAFAVFGPAVMAGGTISDRIMQVAFSALFVAPSAIGPVVGQNFGSGNRARTARAILVGHAALFAYAAVMATAVAISGNAIADLFHAEGETRAIVLLFCHVGVLGWMFAAPYYATVAALNPLGRARITMVLSWVRAVCAVVLPVQLAVDSAIARNLIVFQVAGSLAASLAAMVITAVLVVRLLAQDAPESEITELRRRLLRLPGSPPASG